MICKGMLQKNTVVFSFFLCDNTHMSTLSFAVCAYKESPYLRECIQSLLSQEDPCPVFVSTSTPNDHIRTVAQEFSIPLIIQDHEPGIAADWNSAYCAADTDYVVLAHQDDLYEPEYARTARAALDNASHPLLFFSDYYEIRSGKKTVDTKNLRVKRKLLRPLTKPGASASVSVRRRMLSLGNPICCPAVTYAKANLPSVPFKTGMKSNLDWDAWERFSRLDGDFIYDTHMLTGHRVHASSTTSALIDSDERTKEDLTMLKRFWPSPVARAINMAYKRAETSNKLDEPH